FFFSSRSRHTRFSRDWSSDVCSSDLSCSTATILHIKCFLRERRAGIKYLHLLLVRLHECLSVSPRTLLGHLLRDSTYPRRKNDEIGRASCRERVKITEAAVSRTKRQS